MSEEHAAIALQVLNALLEGDAARAWDALETMPEEGLGEFVAVIEAVAAERGIEL